MKRNKVTLAVLLAALSFFAAPSARAISQADTLAIKKAVANVPAAELAAKAAKIVSSAAKTERKDVAITTVREIVSKRPTAIVAVVAAIAKAAPEVSVAVAAEAAKLAEAQAAEIAKAAATCAPSHAEQIAAAVAKVVPNSATRIAESVSNAVPDQTAKIVETMVKAQPQIANDVAITRLSERSANSPAGSGIITTRPGTIRGGPQPTSPPVAVGAPILGADPQRIYSTP